MGTYFFPSHPNDAELTDDKDVETPDRFLDASRHFIRALSSASRLIEKMLLEGKWRFKNCCCCSVKIGTTVIGVLNLIFSILGVILISAMGYTINGKKDQLPESASQALTAVRIIFGIVFVSTGITAALLLYGNHAEKPKFMTPTIVIWLVSAVLSIISNIIQMTNLNSFGLIVGQLIGLAVGLVISFLLLQVVRSRQADIIELQDRQNKLPYSHPVRQDQ